MADALVARARVTRVSWGGVFAGLFSGLGIFVMLLLVGLAVGFSVFNPNAASGWGGLAKGVGIWGLISAIVSAACGGWIAARLSTSPSRMVGALHGVTVWGLMLVAATFVGYRLTAGTVRTATHVVGGVTGAAAGMLGGTASQLGSAAGGLDVNTMTGQLNDYLRSQHMPAIPAAQLGHAVQDVETQVMGQLRQGRSLDDALNQGTVARSLAKDTNLNSGQANLLAAQLVQQLRKAGDQLQQAATHVQNAAQGALDSVVSSMIPATWGLWICSLLMLLAAALGGSAAAKPAGEDELPHEPTARAPSRPLQPREV